MLHWLRTSTVLVLPFVLIGCPPPLEQEHAGSYVGRVTGTNAFVAIVTNGRDVRAYVTDGAGDGRLTIAEWFEGSSFQNEFNLFSGGAQLTAEIEADTASGAVVLSDGTFLLYEAARADGEAGLYLFENSVGPDFYQAGWIVLSGGDQRGSLLTGGTRFSNTSLDVTSDTATLPGAGTVMPARFRPDDLNDV